MSRFCGQPSGQRYDVLGRRRISNRHTRRKAEKGAEENSAPSGLNRPNIAANDLD